MLFDMVIGADIPPLWRANCIVRGHRHPIYILKDNWLFRFPLARRYMTTVPSQEIPATCRFQSDRINKFRK